MDRDEARKKIDQILKEVEAKIKEAEQVADASSVEFYWSGPAYGMGGTYTPDVDESSEWYSSDAGWHSSSNNW